MRNPLRLFLVVVLSSVVGFSAEPKSTKRPIKLYKVGREAIEQALVRPQRYDFTNESLEKVLEFMADRTGVTYVMDHKTIFDEEKEPNDHTIFRAVNRGDPLGVGFTN